MKDSRPMSAHPGVQSRRRTPARQEEIVYGEPRPKSGFITHSRVLKSNSTAYNNWLRRGDEYSYNAKKQSRSYNNVETFNLRPGCRVTKSASHLQVRMDPDEFFKPKVPKMTAAEMPVKEMQSLIRDLQAQVKYLTVYLEEEKLHHAGTKKRAKVDLQNLKEDMDRQRTDEIEEVMQNHQRYIEMLRREHTDRVEEVEDQLNRQYKNLEKQYKLLQASFRNYKGKVSNDMEEKWKSKLQELDWEKQKSVDNAIETTKKLMEEKFNKERISIRTEYKELMQEMVADQRKEMEEFMRKMSDGKSSIEDLKAKAAFVDKLQEELSDTKKALQSISREFEELNQQLKDTSSKLAIYEDQFEEKVNEVEDKYRKRIDDLVSEVSDFRMLLIKKAETLYVERAASDELQKRLTEFTAQRLQERISLKSRTSALTQNRSEGIRLIVHLDGAIDSTDLQNPKKSDHQRSESPKLNADCGNFHLPTSPNTHHPQSVCRKANRLPKSPHSEDVSPVQIQSENKNQACEPARDISITKAGTDQIRPRLPISTVSPLDTANLPYNSETEYRSQGYLLSRPSSPDVIY